jgi:hypothetical protein
MIINSGTKNNRGNRNYKKIFGPPSGDYEPEIETQILTSIVVLFLQGEVDIYLIKEILYHQGNQGKSIHSTIPKLPSESCK